MNNKKIEFNNALNQVSIQLKEVNNGVLNLSEVLSEFNSFDFKSEYHCPQCKCVLYYDFIGEERVRLFCPNCKKYVFAKINQGD